MIIGDRHRYCAALAINAMPLQLSPRTSGLFDRGRSGGSVSADTRHVCGGFSLWSCQGALV
ncbi:hypothetical protein LOC73_36200, partial [Mycolicibacterium mageritense]|nr:hypothetical protein [Mycolicibacterium mageritense]